MALVWLRIVLLLLILSFTPKRSENASVDGEFDEQWCIADEQTPDDELQMGLDWACGKGGADCTKIQANQSCYIPNTVKDHASYAFNSYFQNFKHTGGSCYFRGAALITELDPSHASCKYEFIPRFKCNERKQKRGPAEFYDFCCIFCPFSYFNEIEFSYYNSRIYA